jgi:hypothetical protein
MILLRILLTQFQLVAETDKSTLTRPPIGGLVTVDGYELSWKNVHLTNGQITSLWVNGVKDERNSGELFKVCTNHESLCEILSCFHVLLPIVAHPLTQTTSLGND